MKSITNHLSLAAAGILAFVGFASSTALAETPGPHPAYLHALADLRNARAHIERQAGDRAVKWDEHGAIKEIDAAIDEIKKAAIDDNKNLHDHLPVDATLDYHHRLGRALEIVQQARADVSQREDDVFAHGLRHRAVQHMDAAIAFLQQGMANEVH